MSTYGSEGSEDFEDSLDSEGFELDWVVSSGPKASRADFPYDSMGLKAASVRWEELVAKVVVVVAEAAEAEAASEASADLAIQVVWEVREVLVVSEGQAIPVA